MYNKLVFVNHFGAGDIFESREFVKHICEQVQAKEYCYSHGKDHRILLDMPFLTQEDETVKWYNIRTPILEKDGNLYVNTWIGIDGRYVLPGIGCTVEMLHKMYKDYGFTLRDDIYSYIPRVDWSVYDTEIINSHLKQYSEGLNVLISNGPVNSSQAENFDFYPVITKLAKKYSEVEFYTTSGYSQYQGLPNIHNVNDIVKDKFNLNEIGYLSKFCGIIVGRCSGPSVFAEHYENWMDGTKIALGFTYTYQGSHFVLSNHLPMDRQWSQETSEIGVYARISEAINEW